MGPGGRVHRLTAGAGAEVGARVAEAEVARAGVAEAGVARAGVAEARVARAGVAGAREARAGAEAGEAGATTLMMARSSRPL